MVVGLEQGLDSGLRLGLGHKKATIEYKKIHTHTHAQK